MKSSKKFFFLAFLLTTLTLTNIIVHDFLCHEELHHLISPIHHSFNHPSFNPLDFIGDCLKNASSLYQANQKKYSENFTPSIFHPPD
ncbi:MAG: hypothetical protein H5U07_07265 [Candidatus Aminicenantes bacterium]|nr:hypothetical protein [Candidatus Aminicenantes bacterium]